MAETAPQPHSVGKTRVLVIGGGVAGAEALLALHELGGDRVSLTLVAPGDELVLPALTVAEPFGLGMAQRYPMGDLLRHVDGEQIVGALVSVDAAERVIILEDGSRVRFDALVIATGARPVAAVEGATTWWPGGDPEALGGLLRDLEEGYSKRVAFVMPPGAVWPLPLYELALMTAWEVAGMGIDDVELTVITPEAVPLALFGHAAAAALRDELKRASVRLETATVARIAPGHPVEVVLQPSARRLEVDRVVALPGVDGPRIPGTTHNDAGFVLVDANGRMRDSEWVWAAGDAIAYPVKFGGLASQQADAAAADIAARLRGQPAPAGSGLRLRGVLMTGAQPRPLGAEAAEPARRQHPIWRPETKVWGKYLTPFLHDGQQPRDGDVDGALPVDEILPEPEAAEAEGLHALWRPEQGDPEFVARLGREIGDYEDRHLRSADILRRHGHIAD